MNMNGNSPKKFYVELIKPSHYDDDGYVIQWWKSWVPSNTLACIYGLTHEAAQRHILGNDVEFIINAYDEINTVIPYANIVRRMKRGGGNGVVFLVGVQSNQFPRAMDIAAQFRKENIQVAMGGFHPSGSIAMLPQVPKEIQDAMDNGVSMFVGEAEEGRLEAVFADAYKKQMKPLYNYLGDLPCLENQATPLVPESVSRKIVSMIGCFDAGRGCSFLCSFCTVINVQGRKSRYRSADDVEKLIRRNFSHGVKEFFITDDNFARNKNWEAIFDRIIHLRENQGFRRIRLTLQVDTLSYNIPNFVSKAVRAGCKRVFIGLESVNPKNLKAVKKRQNNITEYRKMFQAWRNARVVTVAGYIIGFPDDTPEQIERDIKTIQQEIPVDLLSFFCYTPLPGSEDHKNMFLKGEPMDPDLNKYDLEHITTPHPRMSKEEWEGIYRRAWDIYYSPEHIERLLRRAAVAGGTKATRVMLHIHQFYGMIKYQDVHPLQGGFFRRKIRSQRRSHMHRENPLVFYPHRVWETINSLLPFGLYYFRLRGLRKRIKSDHARHTYIDKSLIPVDQENQPLESCSDTMEIKRAI
ncbi:MAG: radical SAM protein [Planctomycetes bacterium]|nr:radical SAM protein [Planctomycetota bacterium]